MDIPASPSLWLLGQKNIQNSLLLGFLQQNLSLNCSIKDQSNLAEQGPIPSDLLICIDASGLRLERCHQILEQLDGHKVFFINLEDDSEFEQMLNWPLVCGFFYKGASHTHISKGIASILDGELWFSRKLLSRFMASNRKVPYKATKNVLTLTKREKQILNLCASGAKNADIASALNVSTHTVKTHMYNLFKKIDVGNRIQAINWAKDHLPEQDFS